MVSAGFKALQALPTFLSLQLSFFFINHLNQYPSTIQLWQRQTHNMHFPTLLSTTALALTANAFLIPAEITDDVQAAKAKAAEFVPQVLDRHNTQSLKLDCTSCPFALNTERHGAHEWANDVESDLVMHFTAKGDHLTLNGNPFYPVTVQDMPGLLYAPQVKKASSASSSEGYEKDLKLSYTLEFQDQKAEDGKTVVNIIMTILGIDGQMVRIDNIGIRAIKHADGTVRLPFLNPLNPSLTILPLPSSPSSKSTPSLHLPPTQTLNAPPCSAE